MSIPVKVFLSTNSSKIQDYSVYLSKVNVRKVSTKNGDSSLLSNGLICDEDGIGSSATIDSDDSDEPLNYFESVIARRKRVKKNQGNSDDEADHDDDEDDDDDEDEDDAESDQDNNDRDEKSIKQYHYFNEQPNISQVKGSRVVDLINHKFSVLLYGFGSKRSVLAKLQKQFNKNMVITIHGYFSELTTRNILSEFKDIFEVNSMDSESIFNALKKEQKKEEKDDNNILIIIYSLDRLVTNNPKSKDILVKFASLRNVQILATVDHLNSQLIFSKSDSSAINLVWINVDTCIPYVTERAYAVCGTAEDFKRSKMLTISAVSHVYESLTPNAQKVFRLIIDYYLEKEQERQKEKEERKKRAIEMRKRKSKSKRRKKNDSDHETSENDHVNGFAYNSDGENNDEDTAAGLPLDAVTLSFSTLYRICREEYLANSDTSLKALLIEFQDHDIVKLAKSSDGSQIIRLRIDLEVAKTFLERLDE